MTGNDRVGVPITTLDHILEKARRFGHAECENCPRKGSAVFGRSCSEHYAGENARGMFVLRDPSVGPNGVAGDSLVCCYCHEDKTAVRHREMMKKHQLDPKLFYITNAVLHGPSDRNTAPSSRAIESCSGVLRSQIEAVNPRLIITCGREAYRATCFALKVPAQAGLLSGVVGKWFVAGERTILPTYHLSPFNSRFQSDIDHHWELIAHLIQ
jgi:uracil-DNA glycosylase